MLLELKNIKHAAFASEETQCYEAAVYIDGKMTFHVSNSGRGGSDLVHPVEASAEGWREKLDEVNAFLAKTCEPMTFEETSGKVHTIQCDLEIWCGEQLEKHLTTKDLKRALNRAILLQTTEGLRELSLKRAKITRAQGIDYVKSKFPTAIILNTLEFDEALKIYTNKN